MSCLIASPSSVRTRPTKSASRIAWARANGDRWLEVCGLIGLGFLHQDHGELNEARVIYEQAYDVAVRSGLRYQQGAATKMLGVVHLEKGRT